MKIYSVCASLIFCSLIFFPCICNAPEKDGEAITLDEKSEPSFTINVLDHVSGEISAMDIESYIEGVVLAEMPASYNEEALKAQSVAARTYAVRKIKEKSHENADICTSYACCCAYISPENYTQGQNYIDKVRSCVSATKGEILTYDDEPITAVFHSMSAGKTTSSADVWGTSVPYLTAVESPLEENEKDFKTTRILSFAEFKEKLKSFAPSLSISSAKDIGEPVRDSSGYVIYLPVGNLSFTGTDIRSLFSLRSTHFYIESDETSVTFTVHGYGHGVGMSQHGANCLAGEGKTYEEILKTYYKGVEISPLETIK